MKSDVDAHADAMDASNEPNILAGEAWPIRVLLWTLAVSMVIALALQLTPRGASTLIGTIVEATNPLERSSGRRVRVQQYSCDYGWPLSSFSTHYADWTLINPSRSQPVELSRHDFGEVLEEHPFIPRPGERLRTWKPSYIALNFVIIVVGTQLIAIAIIARQRRRVRKLREANRCIKCGYYLIGVPVPRCPECGTPFERPRFFDSQFMSTRQRWSAWKKGVITTDDGDVIARPGMTTDDLRATGTGKRGSY